MTAEAMCCHLKEFARRLLSLPEVQCLLVKDHRLDRPAPGETLSQDAVRRAVESCRHDGLSDVDLTVVVDNAAACADFFRQPGRLGVDEESCLGWFVAEDSGVCRVVFRQGFRYDLTVRSAADGPYVPASTAVSGEARWPMESLNRFWFVQVQALGKLYRRDYLISGHLAHMQLNETLVMQMVLRDAALGTCHHRYGSAEAAVWRQFEGQCPVKTGEEDFDRIAGQLYCAAMACDRLTALFHPAKPPRTPALLAIWQEYERERQKGG